MLLISEYGNEITETDNEDKIYQLKKLGFKEYNDTSKTPKAEVKPETEDPEGEPEKPETSPKKKPRASSKGVKKSGK